MTDPVMPSVRSPDGTRGSDHSLLLYTALAILIALVVRVFVAAPYLVSGPSMEPTFHNGDYLIVQKLEACMPFELGGCLYLGAPERGDVIVFKLPANPSETLIKRVIGLPGDTVKLSGNTITVTGADVPQGVTLSEPYLDPADLGGPSDMTITLAADQYFVLGDNRKVSYDSRLWGTLPRKDIIGRVEVRLFPFTAIGFLPGEARYASS